MSSIAFEEHISESFQFLIRSICKLMSFLPFWACPPNDGWCFWWCSGLNPRLYLKARTVALPRFFWSCSVWFIGLDCYKWRPSRARADIREGHSFIIPDSVVKWHCLGLKQPGVQDSGNMVGMSSRPSTYLVVCHLAFSGGLCGSTLTQWDTIYGLWVCR